MTETECRYHCKNGKVFLPSMGLVPCPDCAGKPKETVPLLSKDSADRYLMCDPRYRPLIGFDYDDEEVRSRYAVYDYDPEAYTSMYDSIYKALYIPECYQLGAGKAQRLVGTELDELAITPESSIKFLSEMEREAKQVGTGQNVVDVGYAMYDAFLHAHRYDDSIIMTFGKKDLTPLVYALQMTAMCAGLIVEPYINANTLGDMYCYPPDADPYAEQQYKDIPFGQLRAMDDVPQAVLTKRYAHDRTYRDYCVSDVVFIYVGPMTRPIAYEALFELLEARSLNRLPTYVIGSTTFTHVQNRTTYVTLNELLGKGYKRLTKVMQATPERTTETPTEPKTVLEGFGK